MKKIEGKIIDVVGKRIIKGRLIFSDRIEKIEPDENVSSNCYIMPGLVDAHVHIESSMLTPFEFSKTALKHGVIAVVADPHEIANVCGIDGVRYMIDNAKQSPMKIFFGAPSCVPATAFETAGSVLNLDEIEQLFLNKECSHLSEMMNYPGVISNDIDVIAKIEIAKKYHKIIDGHAPLLTGKDLRKYVCAGVHTDHECTSVHEALEKISLGMKIMLRESSASKDFDKLVSLIKTHSEEVMLCTDDCHPDELLKGYINELVKKALRKEYSIFDVVTAGMVTANKLYKLGLGMLQVGDISDFIVVDDLHNFNIQSTFIDGIEVFSKAKGVRFNQSENITINNFYKNAISIDDLKVNIKGDRIRVIETVVDSLITNTKFVEINKSMDLVYSDTNEDVLKIVVVNRYKKAKPSIGFINGFGFKRGAIASSVAHDSHNIIAVGVDDKSILKAIQLIQNTQGGLTVVDEDYEQVLELPVAGLMSLGSCEFVADQYIKLSKVTRELGCKMHAPFMTLAFMSLLVIPDLKIGDKGLFDVSNFNFVSLQH